ncbi:hypothetical protein IMZ48_07365 [Candidatus Bathyarchaeota archaeon]|nr:hypothetical protein [Candidatus Bathyarchaeota archaeon]
MISEAHFELARRHCIAYQERSIPANVVMLVLVFNTQGETRFNMFPDFFSLYQERLLRLRPTSNFVGKLEIGG